MPARASTLSSMEDLFPSDRSKRARMAFAVAPLLLLAVTAALLGHPATRAQARPWLLYENGPVELLTVAFFTLGGVHGLVLAVRARRAGLGILTVAFYVVYSLGLLFVAGEEIAWGQWLLHFPTPAGWRELNVQGETTLHNLRGMNDHLPGLHVLFAGGGLAGVWAARVRATRWVATPPVLCSWFLLLTGHAALELLTGALWSGSIVQKLFERTSEVAELLLGVAAWLYVLLNSRRLAGAR